MAKSKAAIERESIAAIEAQMKARGVIEVNHYLDWVAGDMVSITGEAGVFNFKSVRVDSEGNPKWANVWGGPKDQEALRSFALDRLEPFTKIKRRGKKKVASEV